MKKTPKQILKEIMGYRLIPQNHIVSIERDGQIVRLAGPGYTRKNFLTERYGRTIPIGFGAKQLEVANVRSIDGDQFNIHARILYTFDPRRCKKQMTNTVVEGGPELVEAILQGEGEVAIRHAVGELETRDLRSGTMLNELGRKIGRSLHATVATFGVAPIGLNWVVITGISLSDNLEKAFEDAAEEQVNVEAEAKALKERAKAEAEMLKVTAKAWEAVPPKVAELMIMADMYKKLAEGNNPIQLFTSPLELLRTYPFHFQNREEMTIPIMVQKNGK